MMVGVCGAIWLALLAATVFAAVAMVRLGSGHPGRPDGNSSWLLYSIIAVSALIIAGAVPLLLRARRGSASAGDRPAEPPVNRLRPDGTAPEQMRVFGVDPFAARQPEMSRPGPAGAVINRLLLRGGAALLATMGLALTAVAVGAYLLADASDTAAWVAFGLAGVITVAMPAVLVFYRRQLDESIEATAA